MRRKLNSQTKEKCESVSLQSREKWLKGLSPAKKIMTDGSTTNLPMKKTIRRQTRTKIGRKIRAKKLTVEVPVTTDPELIESAGEDPFK